MYEELFKAWKQELENADLTKLPSDFYAEAADYVRQLAEETRMLDKRTVKANLLKKETENAKRMIRELIRARFRKLVRIIAKGGKVPPDFLTINEERIFASVSTFSDAFQSLTRDVLQGHKPRVEAEREHKRAVLRFLEQVPAIIGADMKPYGPFQAEDVASLPLDNAKILTRQRLAEKVEAD
jgi:DNA replication initiation complex subunit (GINS family)